MCGFATHLPCQRAPCLRCSLAPLSLPVIIDAKVTKDDHAEPGIDDELLRTLSALPLTELHLGNCTALSRGGLACLAACPMTSLSLRFGTRLEGLWTWRNGLAAVAVLVALFFTSVPAAMLDSAGMSDEEYTGKLKQANLGALAGLGAYGAMAVVYVVFMKRMNLFSNAVHVGPSAAAFNIVA